MQDVERRACQPRDEHCTTICASTAGAHTPWRFIVTLIEMFQAQLEAEAKRTRGALERVPEGKDDWTPHPKSMPLGRLAMLVARMPTWFGLIVNQDDLELNPPAGSSNVDQRPLKTAAELVQAHDEGVEQARNALRSTRNGSRTHGACESQATSSAPSRGT